MKKLPTFKLLSVSAGIAFIGFACGQQAASTSTDNTGSAESTATDSGSNNGGTVTSTPSTGSASVSGNKVATGTNTTGANGTVLTTDSNNVGEYTPPTNPTTTDPEATVTRDPELPVTTPVCPVDDEAEQIWVADGSIVVANLESAGGSSNYVLHGDVNNNGIIDAPDTQRFVQDGMVYEVDLNSPNPITLDAYLASVGGISPSCAAGVADNME